MGAALLLLVAGASEIVGDPPRVPSLPTGGAPDPLLVRGPYLQMGTPTSVVIRWRTDIAVDSRVVYGLSDELPGGGSQAPDSGTLTESVGDAALTTEHELALTGLAPNRRYYYAVGLGSETTFEMLAGYDAVHYFDTAPPSGVSKPTRIWILGDSGEGNQNVRDVRDGYYEYTGGDPNDGTDARHTELWLMLGDNAYPQGTDSDYQTKLFDIFGEMLSKSVLWPAPGNHDLPDNEAGTWPYFDVFTLPLSGEAGGEPSGTEAYYSFDYANIHFVSLDSTTYPAGSIPGSDMLAWLEADLQGTTQDWIIAYFHHPPYSKGAHDSDDPADSAGRLIDMRTWVVPILEAHGVDLVLAGHSHSYERSFLIHGHHGDSSTFDPSAHLVDDGDGDVDGEGAYQAEGPGAVFTVAGNGSILSPGNAEPLNGPPGAPPHPVMFSSLYMVGSLVIDVNGTRLDGMLLDATGGVQDRFTLFKGDPPEAPDADFAFNPLTSQSPMDVRFTDLSEHDPTVWSWDFENDGIADSNKPDPLHTYTEPGQYSVRLTVANSEGTDDVVKTDAICVTSGPPDAVTGLIFGFNKMTMAWDPHPYAVGYDVTRGDLDPLVTGGGDFDSAECVDSVEHPQLTDTTTPDAREALFYLVRAVNCMPQTGTYDTADPGQIGSRDLALQGGGAGCACPDGDDNDQDGYCNGFDNCPDTAGDDLSDLDEDGLGDICDACPNDPQNDEDGDTVCGDVDNCPTTANPDQVDTDGDSAGDACDLDDDADGVPDTEDSAPLDRFACRDVDDDGCDDCSSGEDAPDDDGIDADADGTCDLTDTCVDVDGDGLGNGNLDNAGCPDSATDSDDADPTTCADVDQDGCEDCASSQWNPDEDGADADQDGMCDGGDNCPDIVNADQSDADLDGLGDVCDLCTDVDQDGSGDPGFPQNTCPLDNCPDIANPFQQDSDGDLMGDVCDACRADPENDADSDLVCGDVDNCPWTSNPDQSDADLDETGDACDPCTDGDRDGYGDPGYPANSCETDNCPDRPNPFQQDTDGDLIGDACDSCPYDEANDSDGDGHCANLDNCPDVANPPQLDFDQDGAGDACDDDDDDDGANDDDDCEPLAPGVSAAPGGVGDTVRLDKLSSITLRWLRGFQGHTSNVYGATRLPGEPWPAALACRSAELPSTSTDAGLPVPAGAIVFYMVAPRNACGEVELDLVDDSCATESNESDGDSIADLLDNCPLAANPDQADADGDFVGDLCDNCPETFNPNQADGDLDDVGDACDTD